jgi:hypothetical protein
LFSRPYFGQEMLLESRLEQGNFSQRAVKDDPVRQDNGRRFDPPQLPAVQC